MDWVLLFTSCVLLTLVIADTNTNTRPTGNSNKLNANHRELITIEEPLTYNMEKEEQENSRQVIIYDDASEIDEGNDNQYDSSETTIMPTIEISPNFQNPPRVPINYRNAMGLGNSINTGGKTIIPMFAANNLPRNTVTRRYPVMNNGVTMFAQTGMMNGNIGNFRPTGLMRYSNQPINAGTQWNNQNMINANNQNNMINAKFMKTLSPGQPITMGIRQPTTYPRNLNNLGNNFVTGFMNSGPRLQSISPQNINRINNGVINRPANVNRYRNNANIDSEEDQRQHPNNQYNTNNDTNNILKTELVETSTYMNSNKCLNNFNCNENKPNLLINVITNNSQLLSNNNNKNNYINKTELSLSSLQPTGRSAKRYESNQKQSGNSADSSNLQNLNNNFNSRYSNEHPNDIIENSSANNGNQNNGQISDSQSLYNSGYDENQNAQKEAHASENNQNSQMSSNNHLFFDQDNEYLGTSENQRNRNGGNYPVSWPNEDQYHSSDSFESVADSNANNQDHSTNENYPGENNNQNLPIQNYKPKTDENNDYDSQQSTVDYSSSNQQANSEYYENQGINSNLGSFQTPWRGVTNNHNDDIDDYSIKNSDSSPVSNENQYNYRISKSQDQSSNQMNAEYNRNQNIPRRNNNFNTNENTGSLGTNGDFISNNNKTNLEYPINNQNIQSNSGNYQPSPSGENINNNNNRGRYTSDSDVYKSNQDQSINKNNSGYNTNQNNPSIEYVRNPSSINNHKSQTMDENYQQFVSGESTDRNKGAEYISNTNSNQNTYESNKDQSNKQNNSRYNTNQNIPSNNYRSLSNPMNNQNFQNNTGNYQIQSSGEITNKNSGDRYSTGSQSNTMIYGNNQANTNKQNNVTFNSNQNIQPNNYESNSILQPPPKPPITNNGYSSNNLNPNSQNSLDNKYDDNNDQFNEGFPSLEPPSKNNIPNTPSNNIYDVSSNSDNSNNYASSNLNTANNYGSSISNPVQNNEISVNGNYLVQANNPATGYNGETQRNSFVAPTQLDFQGWHGVENWTPYSANNNQNKNFDNNQNNLYNPPIQNNQYNPPVSNNQYNPPVLNNQYAPQASNNPYNPTPSPINNFQAPSVYR